jgi:hypothetical protein
MHAQMRNPREACGHQRTGYVLLHHDQESRNRIAVLYTTYLPLPIGHS